MGEKRIKRPYLEGVALRLLCLFGAVVFLCCTAPAFADEPQLVTLLRVQAFNKVY